MERFKAALVFLFASMLASCGANAPRAPLTPAGGMPPGSSQARPAPTHKPLDTLGGGPATFSMNVMLGDALPALGGKQLAHLYVGVDEVDVTTRGGQTGMVAHYNAPQVVDVLQYQGSSGASIANSGTSNVSYSAVTFILDTQSSQAVFADGSSAPINYLTYQQTTSTSGADGPMYTQPDGPGAVAVTAYRNFTVPANAIQNVRVDFNAFESLVMSGGALYANPVFFVAPTATAGEVNGTVVNAYGGAVKHAVVVAYDNNGNVKNTAFTGNDGSFDLTTLSGSSVQLVVYNAYTNAAGRTFYSSGSTYGNTYVYGPAVTLQPGQATSAGAVSD